MKNVKIKDMKIQKIKMLCRLGFHWNFDKVKVPLDKLGKMYHEDVYKCKHCPLKILK